MHDASQPEVSGPALPVSPSPSLADGLAARLGITRRQLSIAVIVPVVCLGIVLALRLWLKWVGPFPGDRWALTRNDYGGQAPWALDLGNFFQAAGTSTIAVITIAWGAGFAWRSDGVRGIVFLVIAALGVVFNAALKELSGPTPLMHQRDALALNYPSGHTAYATVVFGALAWMAWRHRRLDIAAAMVFLIALMGPFRVSLGAHFVSDVIAAYLVGIAWLVPLGILMGFAGQRPDARGARATGGPPG